jgi:hypothetical protein
VVANIEVGAKAILAAILEFRIQTLLGTNEKGQPPSSNDAPGKTAAWIDPLPLLRIGRCSGECNQADDSPCGSVPPTVMRTSSHLAQ